LPLPMMLRLRRAIYTPLPIRTYVAVDVCQRYAATLMPRCCRHYARKGRYALLLLIISRFCH